jgi:hypothetical protein
MYRPDVRMHRSYYWILFLCWWRRWGELCGAGYGGTIRGHGGIISGSGSLKWHQHLTLSVGHVAEQLQKLSSINISLTSAYRRLLVPRLCLQ